MVKKQEINMTEGKMLAKILLFGIPLMLSGMLQLLYNAADIIVIGRFAGKECLAAVGSTGSLNNLIVNSLLGLSVGSSVIAARYFGAKDNNGFSRIMHTSVVVSVLGGVIAAVFGSVFIYPLLQLMDSPTDVIDLSAKYMRIIFLGMPAQCLYNYGAAIIRSIGDTRKPLYILGFSGIINVLLNLFLVLCFGMDVDGVAIATITSQYISAALIVITLMRLDNLPSLKLNKLHIHKYEFLGMLKIGIPSGINSSLFSLANVIIQSAVNSFGSVVVAGNSIGTSLEGFVYTAMNTFHHSALTFASQNIGAKKYERLTKGILTCIGCVIVVGIVAGFGVFLFGRPLSSLYNSDPEVIKYSLYRLSIICPTYFICGIMDTISGALRGLGHSTRPMLISIITVCGLRVFFVLCIFPLYKSLFLLYASWPISWLLSVICQAALLVYFLKKLKKEPQTA